MKVIGGIYREICLDPRSDNLYGSAMRSVIALSKGCNDLSLVGMVEPELKEEVMRLAKTFKFKTEIKGRAKEIGFIYDTPLSSPRLYGLKTNDDIKIKVCNHKNRRQTIATRWKNCSHFRQLF